VSERWLRVAGAVVGLVPTIGLVWVPESAHLAILWVSLAIVAAFHGYGRLAAALVDDEDAPVGLVTAWGVAVVVAIAGVLVAAGIYGLAARVALLTAGCVLGAAWLSTNALRLASAARGHVTPGTSAVAVVVGGIMIVQILAAAGHSLSPFLDVETSYLAQLRRVDDTGGLGDAVGFPRTAGLGGQIALAALIGPLDATASHLIDEGILFVIAIAAASSAIRATGFARGLGFAGLTIALVVVPEYSHDMAPYWSLIVLFVGTASTLERADRRHSARLALLAIFVAGAAATVRHPAIVFALFVGIIASRSSRRWPQPAAIGHAAILVGSLACLSYLLAHVRAIGAGIDLGAFAEWRTDLASRTVLWIGLGSAVLVVVSRALPRDPTRTATLAIGATLLAAGALQPSASGAWQYAIPAGLAILVLLGVRLFADPILPDEAPRERTPMLGPAVVVATLAVALVALPRYRIGRPLLSYTTRAAMALADARSLPGVPRSARTHRAAAIAAAQRLVPAGSRLGLFVDRPDLVDHATHDVVDLRTSSVRACLRWSQTAACRRATASLHGRDLRFVLVSDAALPACPGQTRCTDPVTSLLAPGRRRDLGTGIAVIELDAGESR
jgi:hypothetical protein